MKVLMPQLGETVNEGTVDTWHKKPGDEVIKDEILLDVKGRGRDSRTGIRCPDPHPGRCRRNRRCRYGVGRNQRPG